VKHGRRVVVDARVIVGAGGGPEKTILNSPRFLGPAGYHNLCVYLRPPRDEAFERVRARARELDAPLLEVVDRGPFDLSVPWELLDLCRREKADIWHGHDYKTNLLGLLLARFWPMRLVTTLHGWVHHTERTPLYYAIDRVTLPWYELVLCVSPDLHEAALKAGVPAQLCQLVENGIDHLQYARSCPVAEAKARYGTAPGRTVVGAVGRLSPEKGFDLLLRATAELVRRGHDLEAWIIGAGDELRPLQFLATELGLGDRARFWGFRSDTRELYEAMDIYALSSLREGLPNVVLEAMAMEVPVVATRIAGVPRLVQDGENGILITPGSHMELSQAIERLIHTTQLRHQLAVAGRDTIVRRYSFAARMERVRELYDRLLGGARSGLTIQ
jgi:glycosyltransferase involved in cell wall biosynthesis